MGQIELRKFSIISNVFSTDMCSLKRLLDLVILNVVEKGSQIPNSLTLTWRNLFSADISI